MNSYAHSAMPRSMTLCDVIDRALDENDDKSMRPPHARPRSAAACAPLAKAAADVHRHIRKHSSPSRVLTKMRLVASLQPCPRGIDLPDRAAEPTPDCMNDEHGSMQSLGSRQGIPTASDAEPTDSDCSGEPSPIKRPNRRCHDPATLPSPMMLRPVPLDQDIQEEGQVWWALGRGMRKRKRSVRLDSYDPAVVSLPPGSSVVRRCSERQASRSRQPASPEAAVSSMHQCISPSIDIPDLLPYLLCLNISTAVPLSGGRGLKRPSLLGSRQDPHPSTAGCSPPGADGQRKRVWNKGVQSQRCALAASRIRTLIQTTQRSKPPQHTTRAC